MALQYISFPMQDFGAGIDQLSAENKIADGRSELLLNVDPTAQGYLAKRVGYQGKAGNLPLRISRIEYSTASTHNISFLFDSTVDISSIDFSVVRNTPLVVYGRTNLAHSGDFSDTDSVHYYPGFSVQSKRTFNAGTHTLSLTADDLALSSPYAWVGLFEATSGINNSNQSFYPDALTINQGTAAVDIGYTNGGADFGGYVIGVSKAPLAGTNYATAPTACAPGLTVISIPAGTHALSSLTIIPKVFLDDGTSFTEILPDFLTIGSTGDVSVQIQNGTASPFNVVVLLSAVNPAHSVLGSVLSNSTATIQIPNLPGDALFLACYLETVPLGPREWVLPDSILVDSATQTATVTFVNGAPTGANFYLYWETASISTNKISITGAVIGAPYSEDAPQLTLWGLDHAEVYGAHPVANRPGWVTGIDSYRSAGDNRLVAALGGNLFQANGNAAQYLLPTLYPNIRNRAASAVTLAPAFVETGVSSPRTRGNIQFDGANSGWGKATSVSYVSANSVRYSLHCPNLAINGSLATIISTAPGLEDYLTIQQAGYVVNEGTFKILSVSNPSTDVLEILVENPARDSSDWDESDAGCEVGVFTDQLPLLATSRFLPGDVLKSTLFLEDTLFTVTSSSGSVAVLSGISSEFEVPAGLLFVAQRTSSVIPLQDGSGISSVANLLRGDMLTYGSLKRQLRVLSVNSAADRPVTFTGDGQLLTFTLGSGTTDNLIVGQAFSLLQSNEWDGNYLVKEVLTGSTFTSLDFRTGTGAGILQGNSVEVDESTQFSDTVDDSEPFNVPQRWVPIEAPTDSFDLTPNAHYRYLDASAYGEQPILRSTMVSDNLYLTNGQDEVLKFDGVNNYRAGLFRWQPEQFLAVDSNPPAPETGKIQIVDQQCPTTTWNGNRFTVSIANKNTFLVGSKIRYGVNSPTFTVKAVDADLLNGYVLVDRVIGGTPGAATLHLVSTFRYYFRLNAVDIHGNLLASAITGAEDNLVELAQDSQVRLRMIGLPAWDVYQYTRLEVEVYRTKADQVAPFYRLATIPMSFNNGEGYVDYEDTDSDDTLQDLDLTSALSGAELGTGWSQPLISKYVTSMNNRLIQANLTGFQRLDFQFVDTGIRIDAATLSGKKYLFKKGNQDVGTATDMASRATYQFVTAPGTTINPATDIQNNANTGFTITSAAHGLVAGNWVYLFHSAVADGNRNQYAGWFQLNSTTTNTFTILKTQPAGYTQSAQDVDSFVTATDPRDIPVWLGTDGNLMQISGNRDVTSAYQFTAMKRLANAINASMRNVDINLAPTFIPWMVASAGSEFDFGAISISVPKAATTFLEVTLPTFSGYNLFINQVKRSSGEQVSASLKKFPSRVLMSYANFPEIMDSPEATLDSSSASAIDINPADGQEITGIIPFYGDAAFGAAQRGTVLLVFKTNSIYLVDLNAKASGSANVVQRIDSRGLGCTAPYSIAPTKNGIMFANESGIYRIDQSQSVQFIGRWMDRIWKGQVDRSSAGLSLMTGHYYSNQNLYKLSVPYIGDAGQQKVLVYNSTREYQPDGYRDGGWTVYDSHPAIGWANLQTEAFFAATSGRVFSIRQTGSKEDYRDDSAGINMEATLRALDFGESSVRKSIIAALIQFRVLQSSMGTEVFSATNLTNDFQELDEFSLVEPTDEQDSLSDTPDVKVETLRFSIDDRKCVHLQLFIRNSAKDEPLEICGVSFRVAGLNRQGIGSAKGTK